MTLIHRILSVTTRDSTLVISLRHVPHTSVRTYPNVSFLSIKLIRVLQAQVSPTANRHRTLGLQGVMFNPRISIMFQHNQHTITIRNTINNLLRLTISMRRTTRRTRAFRQLTGRTSFHANIFTFTIQTRRTNININLMDQLLSTRRHHNRHRQPHIVLNTSLGLAASGQQRSFILIRQNQ